MHFAFLERDEVAVEGAAEPHGVDVEIGHHDGKPGVEFSLADEVGNDFRRKEMGADGDVGLELGDEAFERTGVEAIEHEPHAIGFPRLVGGIIDDAEDRRRSLNESDVELRIEIAEELIGKTECVDVAHFSHAGLLAKNFLKGRGGANVAGARAGGKNENFAALRGRRVGNFQRIGDLLGPEKIHFAGGLPQLVEGSPRGVGVGSG